jgi:hypothetical protein
MLPGADTFWIAGLLIAGWGLLFRAHARLSGTTAVASVRWAMFAWLWLTVLPWLDGRLAAMPSTGRQVDWSFLAACASLCPGMAILGARRPQQFAWQWIVGSLWLVLILPVLEQSLFGLGGPLEIGPARSWFLAILVVMGTGNYLPTRHAVASLAAGLGQICLLLEHLPGLSRLDVSSQATSGSLLLLLAMCIAARPHCGTASIDPLNRVWRDFRDLYGAAWALRVAERIQSAASQYQWRVSLDWWGFTATAADGDDKKTVPSTKQARGVLHSILRRFVDEEWLERRGFSRCFESQPTAVRSAE